MNFSNHPKSRVLKRAILFLSIAAFVSSLRADDTAFCFNSDQYLAGGSRAGDVELARPPKTARAAKHVLHPFGPSAPEFNYSGPRFSLGYEVRASAPSDLTVGADKAVVEDDMLNSATQRNDTITITGFGDWPVENLYSVAAVVVFPTPVFHLDELSYSALNWTENKPYNEKLRHRWVVQTGGKYYVNVVFLGRTGTRTAAGAVDLISTSRFIPGFDRWVAYDPSVSIFADLNGPQVMLGDKLNNVTAVGFYMDALDYQGAGKGKRQWQLRLITLDATGATTAVPAPAR